MKRKIGPDLLTILRKPAFQQPAAAVLGCMLLLTYALLLVIPRQTESREINKDVEMEQRRLQQAGKIPVPVKAADQEIQDLLAQVPIQDDPARMLLFIQNTAAKTGIRISALTYGETAPDSQTQLETLITKASEAEQAQASSASPGPSATPPPVPDGAAEAKNKLPFEAIQFQLEVKGTYVQVMDFIETVHSAPRVMSITEWSMMTISNESLSASPAATPYPAVEQPVVMKLTVSAYSAPQYAGKLKEAPALEVSPGAQRKDPTLSDAILWELLQQPEVSPGP